MHRVDYKASMVAGLLALVFCLAAFTSTHVAAQEDPCVTPDPTEMPTEVPTEVPTEEPTVAPTEISTEEPTEVSTEMPTEEPSERDWGSRLAFLQSDDPCATEAPGPCVPQTMTEVPATESPTEVPVTETPTEEPSLNLPNAGIRAFLQTSDECMTPTAPDPEPTEVTITVLPETGEGQSTQQSFGSIAIATLLAVASLLATGGYLWLRRSGDSAG